jgi:hypothetical protein
VELSPGDLDITPALDRENLERLAHALHDLGARRYPDEPFGRWEASDEGERRWVEVEPSAADREARAQWRPDAADARSFDHLLLTRHGALDVVPEIAGSYDDLRARAVLVEVGGRTAWVGVDWSRPSAGHWFEWRRSDQPHGIINPHTGCFAQQLATRSLRYSIRTLTARSTLKGQGGGAQTLHAFSRWAVQDSNLRPWDLKWAVKDSNLQPWD